MSWAPVRLDGGGCAQVIAQSADRKTLVAGADTQGFYMSQSSPLATTWTVQQKGIGQATFYRQCATLLWSTSETGPTGDPVIYAGTGDSGSSNAGLLVGTLSGTYPTQKLTWALRASKPQWAGNHAGSTPAGLTTGGIARPTGNLLAQNASFLFAGTYKLGVLRSSNSGGAGSDNFPTACNMAGTAPGTGNWFCYALNLDPTSGNLYAGFFDSTATPQGLWQCTNPGGSPPNFTQIAGGPAMVQDIIFLGAYAYVAGGNDGLWRYGPIGGSPAWQNLNGSTIPTPSGVTSNYWSSVAGYVDGSSNHVVGIVDNNPPQTGAGCAWFATIPSNYPTGSITYTSNGGTTQTTTEPPGYSWWHGGGSYKNWFGGTGFFNPHLIVDASSLPAVNWFTAGSEGCARSLSSKTAWNIANSGMPQFLGHPVAADPLVNQHIVFGDSDWGHFDDTAPGAETAASLKQTPAVSSAQGYALAFDPVDSTVYGSFTGGGQKYSNLGGTVWERPGNAPSSWTKTSFSQAGKNALGLLALRNPDGSGNKVLLAAVWGKGLLYGTKSGSTWTFVAATGGSGVLPSQSGNYASFAYYGGGLVYCYDRTSGLYRSTNYGQAWTLIWSKTGKGDIACNKATLGELWLVQGSNLWYLTGANAGTVTGGGITATQISNVPGSGNCSGAVAVDNHGNVLVTTQDNGSGSKLYRSANQGGTWTSLDTDGSFAQACLNPEHIVVGPDDYIYVAAGNVVTFGIPGGAPPPGSSSAFTERQASGNLLNSGATIALWFSEASGGPGPGGIGGPSLPGNMLSARFELNDGTATLTGPPGWVLDLDVPASAGTATARVQVWRYSNNPGNLGGPGSAVMPNRALVPAALGGTGPAGVSLLGAGPGGLAPAGARGGSGTQLLGGGGVPGGAQVWTCSNPSATVKGKLFEYSTGVGTVQVADQTGQAIGTTGTSFPVTATGPNNFTGGLAVAVFATHWSTQPAGQTWTTPAGWTSDGVGNNSALNFNTDYETGIGAGPITVTGVINPGSGGTQDFWAAGLVTYYAIPATPVSITTASLPNGTTGTAYGTGGGGKQLAGSGGQTPYSWSATGLPPGLSMSGTGLLSGTPTTPGTYTPTVTVTDATTQSGSQAFTIVIAASVTVTTTSPLPGGTTGTAYGPGGAGVLVAATGGSAPYSWGITAGSLPPGLVLSATGLLSGTPLLAGTYTATYTATDAHGATGSASLSLTVITGTGLAVATTALPPATIGRLYGPGGAGFQLTAQGGHPAYSWALSTATYGPTYGPTYTGGASSGLPAGIGLSPGGLLSGTPTGPAGSYPVTFIVTDSAGGTASVTLTLVVSPGAPPPTVKGPWRFLWGPTQPTGGVTAEVLQAQNKTVTLRAEVGQNHEASFDVLGDTEPAEGIVELETDLIVMYGAQIVFDGRVGGTQDQLDAGSHVVSVTAADYREVLRRRAIFPDDPAPSWTSMEQATIAWNLIQRTQARAGGNLGITRGAGQATGTTRTITFTVGDYVSDDIDTLAALANGFEWQVNPYGLADLRLDIYPGGFGQNNGVVLEWGSDRIASITRVTDPSTFGDSVYVTGDPSVTLTAQALDAPDIATRAEQRWDLVIGTTMLTQPSLNDDATALLNQSQVVIPAYTVVFHPGQWDGPQWLWYGDTVELVINSGRLQVDELLRVVEMSFAIDSNNVETLTATVGALPFRPRKAIPKILKRLRYLETR